MRWLPRPLFLAATLAALPAAADDRPDPAALLAEGRKMEAIAEYATAADRYEAFVRLSPAASEAREALLDATALRLGLGQREEARKDTELLLRNYGAKMPELAARLTLSFATYAVDHEEHGAAKKQLTAWLTTYERNAPRDARIIAHASLGRTFAATGDLKKAAAEYGKARALWSEPRAPRKIVAEGDRRLSAALTAVGEALFFAAEQRRKEVDAIRFPAYHGPGDKEAILKHLNTKVADWIKQKRPAIEAAEKEYQKVLELQAFPPPRWVIASAAQVGGMWARFAAEFRTSPIPNEWKRHGLVPGTNITYDDLRATYYGTIDDAAEPLRQHAKAAFEVCVNSSTKYQYADAYSKRCATWLSRNYRTEFPPVDEILPRWGFLGAPETPDPLPDPR